MPKDTAPESIPVKEIAGILGKVFHQAFTRERLAKEMGGEEISERKRMIALEFAMYRTEGVTDVIEAFPKEVSEKAYAKHEELERERLREEGEEP